MVGGLVAFALIAGLVWFLLRRRKRLSESDAVKPKFEEEGVYPLNEHWIAELHTSSRPSELAEQQVVELEDNKVVEVR